MQTLEAYDKIVANKLRINIKDPEARIRMKGLFLSNLSLLKGNELSWLTTENEIVSVHHVLSAIRPKSLRSCLESDLDFLLYALRKYFKRFMHYNIMISETF